MQKKGFFGFYSKRYAVLCGRNLFLYKNERVSSPLVFLSTVTLPSLLSSFISSLLFFTHLFLSLSVSFTPLYLLLLHHFRKAHHPPYILSVVLRSLVMSLPHTPPSTSKYTKNLPPLPLLLLLPPPPLPQILVRDLPPSFSPLLPSLLPPSLPCPPTNSPSASPLSLKCPSGSSISSPASIALSLSITSFTTSLRTSAMNVLLTRLLVSASPSAKGKSSLSSKTRRITTQMKQIFAFGNQCCADICCALIDSIHSINTPHPPTSTALHCTASHLSLHSCISRHLISSHLISVIDRMPPITFIRSALPFLSSLI